MRKSRYSEEKIIRVLQQVESGQKVKDVVREHGIPEQTYLPGRGARDFGRGLEGRAHSSTKSFLIGVLRVLLIWTITKQVT